MGWLMLWVGLMMVLFWGGIMLVWVFKELTDRDTGQVQLPQSAPDEHHKGNIEAGHGAKEAPRE